MTKGQSIKWNTSANFVGLGYTTIVGIVVLPLYLQYLGAEAFGLVGFFLVLQVWMQVLDMGMSPLLSRQAAHFRGQNDGYQELKRLLRSLELIVLAIAITAFLGIAAASTWVTTNWLNVSLISPSNVGDCIILMGATIGLRFFAVLHRSGIQGLEAQVKLNIANVVVVSLKFIGALLLLKFVTQDIVEFFVYQFFVGVFESGLMATLFYRLVPATERVGFTIFWRTLKPVLPFAGSMAYTAAIWVLLTQLDKLVLSNVLTLSDYGYFSIAAVVAAGISQIGAPISQAILPRMTYLLSQDKETEMLLLYRQSTQLMAAIALPLAGVIAFFSTELLFAWTGNAVAADWAGPVLFWFALGNGILTISAFQFYLQFAHGKLGMHVAFNSVAAVIQVPLILYAAYEYGVMGVALTWFALRLLTFIVWTPMVHKRFADGIHLSWLFTDIGPSFVVTSVLLLAVMSLDVPFDNMSRPSIFVTLIGVGSVILLCNVLVSRAPRNLLLGIATRAFTNEE
jgi:O-antigen/teichoic acid export membrane protein